MGDAPSPRKLWRLARKRSKIGLDFDRRCEVSVGLSDGACELRPSNSTHPTPIGVVLQSLRCFGRCVGQLPTF